MAVNPIVEDVLRTQSQIKDLLNATNTQGLTQPVVTPINEFVDKYLSKYGLARNNRFSIDIQLPPTLSGMDNYQEVQKLASLYALAVDVPGWEFSTQLLKLGATRELVYDKNQHDLTITFIDTNDRTLRKFFESWCRSIILSDDTVEYYDEYVAKELVVGSYDVTNLITYVVRFNEVYPKVLSPEQHVREAMNDYISFQVTFAFRKMYETDSDYSKHTDYSRSQLKFGTSLADAKSKFEWNPNPAKAPPLKPLPNYPSSFWGELHDYYLAYQRVVNEINNNTLTKPMGLKLLAGIIRDFKDSIGSGQGGDKVDQLINMIESSIFIIQGMR